MTYKEAIAELQSYAEHSWGGLSEAFELAITAMLAANQQEDFKASE